MRWPSRIGRWRRKFLLLPLRLGATVYWLEYIDHRKDDDHGTETYRTEDGREHRFVVAY